MNCGLISTLKKYTIKLLFLFFERIQSYKINLLHKEYDLWFYLNTEEIHYKALLVLFFKRIQSYKIKISVAQFFHKIPVFSLIKYSQPN